MVLDIYAQENGSQDSVSFHFCHETLLLPAVLHPVNILRAYYMPGTGPNLLLQLLLHKCLLQLQPA